MLSDSKMELKVREALVSHDISWSSDAAKSSLNNYFLGTLEGLDKDRVNSRLKSSSSWAGTYCDHQTSTLMGSQGSSG